MLGFIIDLGQGFSVLFDVRCTACGCGARQHCAPTMVERNGSRYRCYHCAKCNQDCTLAIRG